MKQPHLPGASMQNLRPAIFEQPDTEAASMHFTRERTGAHDLSSIHPPLS